MAAPAFFATIREELALFLDRLPFLPKRGKPHGEEPFHELVDHSSEDGESFSPNALPSGKAASKRAKLDYGAVFKDLVSKPAVIGGLALFLLFSAAVVTVTVIANAAAPGSPPEATLRPSTPEGRAAASRLILPPDPARDLSPPMERDVHFPYTDEDIRRLAPAHGADQIAPIAGRNDRAMDAIFGAVP